MRSRIIVPDHMRELYRPHRNKVLHGGRGGAKSHTIAESLLVRGMENPLRIVCYREIQRSISGSVKRLFDDKIDVCGFRYFYHSTDQKIVGQNGTEITFSGLFSNAENVKSSEGIQIAWIEEANTVSAPSLELLIPTIRQDGSELIFSFNPKNATDPVQDLFLNPDHAPPPNSWIQEMHWRDNDFLPEVLLAELEYDRGRDMDKYLHVWEGHILTKSKARVFNNWTVDDLDQEVEGLQAHVGMDFGFAKDPTVAVELYVIPEKRLIYIRDEAYQLHCKIHDTAALIAGTDDREVPRWENRFNKPGLQAIRTGSRIIADSATPILIAHLKDLGFEIFGSKKGKGSVQEGVDFMLSYDIVVHPRCIHTEQELTWYQFKTDKLTGLVTNELGDNHNHVIDSCRYALEDVRRPAASSGLATFIPEIIKSQC